MQSVITIKNHGSHFTLKISANQRFGSCLPELEEELDTILITINQGFD